MNVKERLKLLADLKPIEGLDTETFKRILEETSIEDTFCDESDGE